MTHRKVEVLLLCSIVGYIFQHQGVGFMLADMAIGVETARALSMRAAWEIDQGRAPNYFVSIAKTFAAEVANRAAADAVQVF